MVCYITVTGKVDDLLSVYDLQTKYCVLYKWFRTLSMTKAKETVGKEKGILKLMILSTHLLYNYLAII